jgi:hypothetical protein
MGVDMAVLALECQHVQGGRIKDDVPGRMVWCLECHTWRFIVGVTLYTAYAAGEGEEVGETPPAPATGDQPQAWRSDWATTAMVERQEQDRTLSSEATPAIDRQKRQAGILDDAERDLEQREAIKAAYYAEREAPMVLTARTLAAIQEFLALKIPPSESYHIPGQEVPRRGIFPNSRRSRKPNGWPLVLEYGETRNASCVLYLTTDGILRMGDGRPPTVGWVGHGRLELTGFNHWLKGDDPVSVEAAVIEGLARIARSHRR